MNPATGSRLWRRRSTGRAKQRYMGPLLYNSWSTPMGCEASRLRKNTIAHTYLRNARYCYLCWGVGGKVRQLEQSHPHLREDLAPQRSTTTISAPIEHLD